MNHTSHRAAKGRISSLVALRFESRQLSCSDDAGQKAQSLLNTRRIQRYLITSLLYQQRIRMNLNFLSKKQFHIRQNQS